MVLKSVASFSLIVFPFKMVVISLICLNVFSLTGQKGKSSFSLLMAPTGPNGVILA